MVERKQKGSDSWCAAILWATLHVHHIMLNLIILSVIKGIRKTAWRHLTVWWVQVGILEGMFDPEILKVRDSLMQVESLAVCMCIC